MSAPSVQFDNATKVLEAYARRAGLILGNQTLNDADASLKRLADWVMTDLGPDVPVHFTRFHPDYQLRNLAATPVATLERARDMAIARGLRYVYVGNVPGHPGNHTYCPKCRARVIARQDFFVLESSLKDGRCARRSSIFWPSRGSG